MSEPTLNLFGPVQREDVRVGYISTQRGYVQGVDVCQANAHAKRNPGETFIYKPTRETIRFLNINEVNKLAEDPLQFEKNDSCPGEDGLNLKGIPKPPRIIFMGGGGVGAVGNPVISESGRLMAVQMVNGGYGYQYPPIVQLEDDTGVGAGAVIKVGVCTTRQKRDYYTDKDDFEEYNLCENEYTSTAKRDGGRDSSVAKSRSPYGRRWSADGKDIGPWEPGDFIGDAEPLPFEQVIADYVKRLNESGKNWWNTRSEPPLKTTSNGKTTKEFFKVQHHDWGGTSTALTEVPFEIHWHSPHRKSGLGFEFTARDGSHSFRILDTSGKNDGKKKVVYKVKENVTYDVKAIGKRPGPDFKSKQSDKINELAEMGLLAKMDWSRGKQDRKLDVNRTGTGDKIFADFLDTLDDADDIQVQAHRGKFTASNERRTPGLRKDRRTYDLTYRLETGKIKIDPSFMNTYAISPKPASNIKGSDFAGKWFTFEWEKEFPYDGDYIFRSARDNEAKLYIDNNFVMDMEHFRGRKALGVNTGKSLKKTIKKGNHKIRIDLYNNPELGTVYDQQPPPPSTSDITFKITTGSMFSNGVRIEGLDIDESKPFTPVNMGKKGQLNVSHTRKIEYGKKYKVVFTSKGISGGQGDIKYSGLHSANTTIRVARKGKRIELVDGHEQDTNFGLDIDSGKAKFSSDGRKLLGSGEVKLTATWGDGPMAGYAVNSVQIAGKTWRRTGNRGSQTHTIILAEGSAKPNIKLRTKEPNIIQMEDFHDNDWTDVIVAASGGQFTDLRGDTAYFSVPHPPKKTGKSGSDSGKTAKVFNTLDYINKSNRKLWRTNVFDRGGFLNDYGVCPFDTNILLKDNPYAGTHSITWPNVNFPISGNYDIQVAVDDTVDIKIGDDVRINKKGFVGDTSVSTGTLKLTRFIKAGNHNIVADLYQKPGGSYGFREPSGKKVSKNEVTFKVTSSASYANKITIPGLFSIGKEYKGAQINRTITKQVDAEKEYDVILNSEQSKHVRVRIKNKGKRLEMEEWKDGDWQDIVCTITEGEFYGAQANRCKFRVDRTIKGINPMALAINIESTYTARKVITPLSWNENPMGVAMTIEAPPPPIPQEPIPKAEGRCPNNPYWTTRFPGAKERWYPVTYKGWGKLLNEHGISPLPPYDKHRNPVVDVSFDVFWSSPHRKKGLGYRFTAQDGSHSFTIIDKSRTHDGTRNETHKVKLNTTYNVKAIGQRTAAQGSKIGPDALGGHDNSKVIELAEQGLLKTQLGVKGGATEGKTNKLDANRTGTGDKIFADFLDTLDDADDLQIQAGSGQFTAFNPKTVQSLRGTRTTYDLTYRVDKVPPNDAGNFTNTWTKSVEFGGWYKAQMEVDDIGEMWIDDKKVIDLDRRKKKTFDEKLVWIDGPTSDEEYRKKGATKHEIKIVVENFKSEKMKKVNAKVFNTLDWVGGGISKAEKKNIQFKITSGSMFANSIKIPELDIHESKPFTPVSEGQRGQIKVTREREVVVGKVYNVEFYSSGTGDQNDWGIKYTGLHSANETIKVRRNGKRIELKDGHGDDTNFSLTIDRGNVKFASDGKKLIVKGKEARITASWGDGPMASYAVESVQIGDKVWRRKGDKGSKTLTVTFPRNSGNTANIKLKNQGESVVRMEDHTDNDWTDIICAASEGRFFDFNNNTCKYMVTSATKTAGGVSGGTTKNGVTYKGPHLFHYTDTRWGRVMNREGVSPIASRTQSLSDPNDNIGGKKILTWQNVDFPQTGKYQINFVADNWGDLFIDDKKVLEVRNNFKENEYNIKDIDVGKGKHNIRIELTNGTASNIFLRDPTGVALRIYTMMTVGSGNYKSWKENPVGVSAKLIPPPCPKESKGKGVVCNPIVTDGGNKYPKPPGPGIPTRLKLTSISVTGDPINYNCAKDKAYLVQNGQRLDYPKLSLCSCGPFGRIEKICIEGDGYFTEPPDVVVDSPTGVNLTATCIFTPEIVPPDIPDIIQVTDLVGLKQTGYYKGKPYYGAVFYENGVKYSGWYQTAGEMVQVYDTMQESIDAQVTTPPSAIQRQGSDPGGNDPRLDIPNTPETLT